MCDEGSAFLALGALLLLSSAPSGLAPSPARSYLEMPRMVLSSTGLQALLMEEEIEMRRVAFTLFAIAVGGALGFFIALRTITVRGAAKPGTGAIAIPGQVGGQDMFGAYDVVKGWPQDIGTLPGNEKWTWGAGQGIFAENPNRVFMLFRGELPNIKAPRRPPPGFGPQPLSRSAGCPGVTLRPPPCPALAARGRIPTMAQGSGEARAPDRRGREMGALPHRC